MAENDITQILKSIDGDRQEVTRRLLPIVYDELRRLAANKLAREEEGHTLQPTALVHEAYLRLLGSGANAWDNRIHFFSAAAEAMRRILIDHARSKKRIKRGGGQGKWFPLDSVDGVVLDRATELIALDDALVELAKHDAVKAELVKLKFFGGLTTEQAAESLEISVRTAERHWAFSRAWLYREISAE